MTPELKELYQELILDHNKTPRNFHPLKAANHKAEGYNPLCGDRFTLYLQIEGDTIKDIGFEGSGCAISKASASLMTASGSIKSSDPLTASSPMSKACSTPARSRVGRGEPWSSWRLPSQPWSRSS